MTKASPDDIDLLFTLHKHGWSTCLISWDIKRYEIGISHAFGDPIGEWVECLSRIVNGADSFTFNWWDEPGGHRIQVDRLAKAQHLIEVLIDEFSESYGDEITEYRRVLNFKIKAKTFVAICYFQLKKLQALLKDPAYATDRRFEFPHNEFLDLEPDLKQYLDLDL